MYEITEDENVFEELDNISGIDFNDEQKQRIREKLTSVLSYEPRIGILGKTSVGKSSLCNALFGQEICEISDIEACTRDVQEILLDIGGKGLKLMDVPGIGESSKRDKEYGNLYKKLLPELDLVLWVLRADDRSFTLDETFYNNIVKPHISKGTPFFFVINQVDKIEPYREWDDVNHEPGYHQQENIERKISSVSEYFSIDKSKIIPVSANEKWNLSVLIDEIVQALPRDKKISFFSRIPEENRSETSESVVQKAWYECVCDTIVSICNNVKDVLVAVVSVSGGAIERFFQKILGL